MSTKDIAHLQTEYNYYWYNLCLSQQFYYQMNSYSPIRTLDPRDSSLERLNRLKYESLRDYRLEEENIRLRSAVERTIADSRARQYLSKRSIEDLAAENTGLNRELAFNIASTARIENNVNLLLAQNQELKDRLVAQQANKMVEVEKLRRKYMEMQVLGRNQLQRSYAEEIGFLLREIDRLKILLGEKSVELEVQFNERLQEKQEYDANICKYISEINNLKNHLLIQQSQKNQQIRELNAKTELERSRTVGIIGSSKESTTFMDREIRKLAEEIANKNNQLNSLTKNYLSEKRKNEEQTKVFNNKVTSLMAENQSVLRDRMAQFEKREAALKEQILDQKRKQTQLYMKIDQMEKEYQVLQHEYQLLQRDLSDNQNEVKTLKQVLQKQREEHMMEISKLMNQKIRRRSSKMLSSQRSLNSSLKDSNIVESRQDIGSPAGDKLPTVKEEVYLRESKQSQEMMQNKSLLEHNDLPEEDTDYNALINHYQSMIEQLKKSHNVDMEVMKLEMQKLRKQLSEKQQQFEDILKRFTPLVKIHAGEKTIEQDRKERIERHWKADIALLEILLDKYRIQAF